MIHHIHNLFLFLIILPFFQGIKVDSEFSNFVNLNNDILINGVNVTNKLQTQEETINSLLETISSLQDTISTLSDGLLSLQTEVSNMEVGCESVPIPQIPAQINGGSGINEVFLYTHVGNTKTAVFSAIITSYGGPDPAYFSCDFQKNSVNEYNGMFNVDPYRYGSNTFTVHTVVEDGDVLKLEIFQNGVLGVIAANPQANLSVMYLTLCSVSS